jgi:hypothetical protein
MFITVEILLSLKRVVVGISILNRIDLLALLQKLMRFGHIFDCCGSKFKAAKSRVNGFIRLEEANLCLELGLDIFAEDDGQHLEDEGVVDVDVE